MGAFYFDLMVNHFEMYQFMIQQDSFPFEMKKYFIILGIELDIQH